MNFTITLRKLKRPKFIQTLLGPMKCIIYFIYCREQPTPETTKLLSECCSIPKAGNSKADMANAGC